MKEIVCLANLTVYNVLLILHVQPVILDTTLIKDIAKKCNVLLKTAKPVMEEMIALNVKKGTKEKKLMDKFNVLKKQLLNVNLGNMLRIMNVSNVLINATVVPMEALAILAMLLIIMIRNKKIV